MDKIGRSHTPLDDNERLHLAFAFHGVSILEKKNHVPFPYFLSFAHAIFILFFPWIVF